MGKNNKARRAAKAKVRAKARARWGSGWQPGPGAGYAGDSPGWDGPEWDGTGWSTRQPPHIDQASLAAYAWRMAAEGDHSREQHLRRLREMPRAAVCEGAESLLRDCVNALWASGWQPTELHRQGTIGCTTSAAARLVGMLIAADHATRPARTLDPRWLSQVEALALPPVDGRGGWLARWAREEGLELARLVDTVLEALDNLFSLPVLTPLIPPPGGTLPGAPQPRGAQSDPLLERIRNLLAKAESTSFEAEAIALTAKAEELMTRHAIDAALLQPDATRSSEPLEVRLPVDAPYADAKSLLLHTVAEASRCRAVYLPRVGMSTVVGYGDDVAGVELLFTSLLVQAQHALAEAARHAAPGTRTRSQSYRSSFLLSFAHRIGERLREINEAVLAAAESEHGGAFLPVLSSMSDSLDAFLAERFGDTYSARVRGGYDAAGWSGGWFAADNARLSNGELADDRRQEA